MQVDIVGKVRNTQLPSSAPLLPLYEAIINSIESIEEANNSHGRIDITIKREKDGLQDRDGSVLDTIIGFEVKDNGLGFTDENLNSFQTSDSTYKEDKGGKGIGRFLWLKAFDRVEIDSIYSQDGSNKRRKFTFVAEFDGIKEMTLEDAPQNKIETTAKFCGYKTKYQKCCPKRLETIAAHVIEYCLEYFLRPHCPQIYLHDDLCETMNLNDHFEGDMLHKQTMEFEINGQKFWGLNVRLRSSYSTDHFVHYCADHRVVRSDKLSGKIPNLKRAISDDEGRSFFYASYIESDVLNESVNGERTNFALPEGADAEMFDLSWKLISDGVIAQCEQYLKPFTDTIREGRIRDINNYIITKAPIYRPLAKYINNKVDDINSDADEKQLELEIYKIYQQVQYELKEQSQEIQEYDEEDDFEEYQEKSKEYFNKILDLNKSDLARYVCDRKAVLDYLRKQLELQKSGKYATEDVIHNVIFPMGKTSDEVGVDDHHLWLLDEKLVYHQFLASDKSLRSMEPLNCESGKEPDILVLNTFDKACAFSDSELGDFTSIVLVEFKRPMRSNYTDVENPFVQLMNYIDDINSGKATTEQGRRISVSSQPIPYYCYIICDIDSKLEKLAKRFSMTHTPDGQGFFGYNKDYNAYFEVISYDKMIINANKRNKILFDKLNL